MQILRLPSDDKSSAWPRPGDCPHADRRL